MVNVEKIKSVVAYLARRTSPGKVKLFKLMYLADFTASAELGRSITGDIYDNFAMGPVPHTLWQQFVPITRACVHLTEVDTGAIPEQQMTARADFHPDLDGDELAVLDKIVSRFGTWSGNQLRDYTHRTIPYRASLQGDSLKYGLAVYLDYKKPSRSDVDKLLTDQALMRELRDVLNGGVEKRQRPDIQDDADCGNIHAGLHDEITVTFDLDGRTIHWHWMPPLRKGLSALDILTTVEQSGLIRVLIIRFSTKRPLTI